MFNLICVFFLIIFFMRFFIKGFSYSKTVKNDRDFSVAGKSLGANEIAMTWFGTTVAFGTATLYYMQIVPIWGWYVLIGSVGTYIVGQFLYAIIAKKSDIDFSNDDSISCIISERVGSKYTEYLINFLNYFQNLSILFLEIFFGIVVITFLFPNYENIADAIYLAIMCTVIYIYVSSGGFKAVADSDMWQSYLILVSILILALVGGVLALNNFQSDIPMINLTPTVPQSSIWLYLTFAFLVNVSTSLGQVSTWQRFFSGTNSNASFRGALFGISFTAMAFIIAVLVAGTYSASGYPVVGLDTLFLPFSEFVGYWLYLLLGPLLIVGFVAATVSTADSVAVSAVYSIYGKVNSVTVSFAKYKRLLVLTILLAVSAYFISKYNAWGFTSILVPVALLAYSATAFFMPLVVLAVLYPDKLRDGLWVNIGIVLGIISIVAGWQYDLLYEKGNYFYQIIGVLVGTCIVFLFSYRITKKSE